MSICIPAFNAAAFIRETLESVRAQTFTDWELIVTEDGSRDGTEEIVNNFAKTVTQTVRYTRHDPNQGLPATRNAGISQASAEWIALLDADDLWEPDHLENLFSCAQKTQVDIIHSACFVFDSTTGQQIDIRVPSRADLMTFPLSLFRGEYIIQPSSVLLRRALWQRVEGFDPSFRHVEDREMWIRCVRAGAMLVYNEKTTCRYRRHFASLSVSGLPMSLAYARVFEKNIDWNAIPLILRKNLAARSWYAYGRIALRNDPANAAKAFVRSFCHQPLDPRTLLYWMLSKIWHLRKIAGKGYEYRHLHFV